jgi:hypothetical protein
MDISAAQTTSQTSAPDDAQFDTLASAAIASADTTSASNIQTLGLVHQARTARLARNVINLTALHGAKSAVVVAAQAAQANAQTIATRVELVRRQAVAVAPTVTATGWAVWGHVYQSPATPLSGYTVFLVDSQKTYQSQYGFATTAADGSFAIVYPGEPANSAPESNTAAGTPAPAAEQTAQPTIPTLFLSITNTDAQLVPTATTPLALATGQALYIDTTLAAGESLADLPAEVRKTAQPPTQKKKP